MLKEFVEFLKHYGVIGLAIAVIIGGILYGKVIGSAIDFLIVAAVIFVIAKFVFKEERVVKK